jgi:hypothetical protein
LIKFLDLCRGIFRFQKNPPAAKFVLLAYQ